ncbi:MAG TPA: hypothetical protein VE011_00310 [Candidatus Dormibacteraeota bacterium]|nr:hypothetical protein [Candidatus Dormibacteraeota bacterium]
MAGTDPGDRIPAATRPRPRPLSEPPSARFAPRPERGEPGAAAGSGTRAALGGPIARAVIAAIVGAMAIVGMGGVLAYPFGLPFIAGGMGAIVGLLMARAAVPDRAATPVPRPTVVRIAVAIALGGVVAGFLGLWLFAQSEGGVLGPLSYLSETFGLLVPAVAIVAVLTAWWGATSGPVQR